MSGRPGGRTSPTTGPTITPEQIAGFRLRRHRLIGRAAPSQLRSVLRAMNGAQAQLLSAAHLSVAARVDGVAPDRLERGLWTERRLARAWCMRRTLHLLPASELAVYARGSTRRAEKEVRWLRNRGVSASKVARIIDATLACLDRPRTTSEIAAELARSHGARRRERAGGGWGGGRNVPWVRIDRVELPVGYLLHLAGARGVTCCGPGEGGAATYVRADAWLGGWSDLAVPAAEDELLRRYLQAFGPATPHDFAVWSGLRTGDARELWARAGDALRQVETGDGKAWILEADLSELRNAGLDAPVVRLLPHFDSFLLGHRDHATVVDPAHRARVYRPQGWVAPVLLVNGRAAGVWAATREGAGLTVRLVPFRRLTPPTARGVQEEAARIGEFLGAERVGVAFADPLPG